MNAKADRASDAILRVALPVGRCGVDRLVRRFLDWRVPSRWYQQNPPSSESAPEAPQFGRARSRWKSGAAPQDWHIALGLHAAPIGGCRFQPELD